MSIIKTYLGNQKKRHSGIYRLKEINSCLKKKKKRKKRRKKKIIKRKTIKFCTVIASILLGNKCYISCFLALYEAKHIR